MFDTQLRRISVVRIESEKLIALQDIPLMDILPVRKSGKRLSMCTIYRWAKRGLKGRRLATVMIGGQRYTSLAALQQFFRECSGEDSSVSPAQASPLSGNRSSKAVEQALDQLRIGSTQERNVPHARKP
jgi:hypothetical protein